VVFVSANAFAAPTMDVTASIADSCVLGTHDMAFGAFNPTLNTNKAVTGHIRVTCTNGFDFNIAVGAGNATGATVTTRQMQDGANLLDYSLSDPSQAGVNWGVTSPQTGTGSAVAYDVSGNIPAQVSALSGNYSDTVTITLTP
jgi:spore coat protein U-like protein